MDKKSVLLLAVFIIVSVLAAGCGQPTAPSATEAPKAPGAATQPATAPEGAALLQQRCTGCHNLTRVESAQKTADQWKATVDRMVGKGAQLTPGEENVLISYLAATYKPASQ